MTVVDETTRHVVAFDRFNQIDYTFQLLRLSNLAQKYQAAIIMDSTGVGDPLFEQVRKLGYAVEGFNFTNTSQQQLVEHLAVLLEQQRITFPNIPELIKSGNYTSTK